ncbi:MAG: oxidoreductase [Saprospiraceae bacterium]|nr:oxidoreductase [Saprospiraceae bacterium]
MPPAHWYTGLVVGIKELAPKVKSFELEIPEVVSFDFIAGQFITLDLPVGDKRLQRWRSYSISSAPAGTNKIELCIVHFDGGLGSTYFFDQVVVGTELKFKGPEGGFVLPEVIDQDVVMICTGTGIAPFRSMIWDIYLTGKTHRAIHLIFGTRRKEDILYALEWEWLMNNIPGFKFEVALSRESVSSGPEAGLLTKLHAGHVHPIYQAAYDTPRPDIHFYLCGWSKMIDEAVENLFGEIGFGREQIHFELYG